MIVATTALKICMHVRFKTKIRPAREITPCLRSYHIFGGGFLNIGSSTTGDCERFFPFIEFISGADLGGVAGVATPPNDFEQPLPLIYKAYYSLAQ